MEIKPPPKRIIIDTDPGIDDSLAILLALASPEVALEGLTVVHGNCSTAQGVTNALSVLELAGAIRVPVAKGCELPLVQPSLLAPETHGNTGLGYAQLPKPQGKPILPHGSDFLIEKIMANPGEITLVAIGPLTNLALAIRKEPRLVQAVKEVFIMGGALRHEGNTTPLAEFNTYVDPHAAHIVYHSGMPITLTPLDVTYQCILLASDVARIETIKSDIPPFIADSTRFYMEFHDAYQGIQGCVINDPLTLALTFAPNLCDYEAYYLDVDISGGISMGKTLADFYKMTGNSANMRVAVNVRPRAFMDLFVERMKRFSACMHSEAG